MYKKLTTGFYRRPNVLEIAKELLGKIVVAEQQTILTAARIVEVEAYNGVTDKAAHSYGGRRTARTEVMYAAGGLGYVYLCYGIHHLFNVVTGAQDIPQAILIRGAMPIAGIDEMMKRCHKNRADHSLTRGPGNFAKALGITISDNGRSLLSKELQICHDEFVVPEERIKTSPRIGVDYAEEDALLPYRFYIEGNPYVSGKPV